MLYTQTIISILAVLLVTVPFLYVFVFKSRKSIVKFLSKNRLAITIVFVAMLFSLYFFKNYFDLDMLVQYVDSHPSVSFALLGISKLAWDSICILERIECSSAANWAMGSSSLGNFTPEDHPDLVNYINSYINEQSRFADFTEIPSSSSQRDLEKYVRTYLNHINFPNTFPEFEAYKRGPDYAPYPSSAQEALSWASSTDFSYKNTLVDLFRKNYCTSDKNLTIDQQKEKVEILKIIWEEARSKKQCELDRGLFSQHNESITDLVRKRSSEDFGTSKKRPT